MTTSTEPILYAARLHEVRSFEASIISVAFTLWNFIGNSERRAGEGMRKYRVGFEGREEIVEVLQREDDSLTFRIDGETHQVFISPEFDPVRSRSAATASSSSGELRAPISGILSKVLCKTGDQVKAGDALVVLEAMKMENKLCAIADGVVSEIHAEVGKEVRESELLVSLQDGSTQS